MARDHGEGVLERQHAAAAERRVFFLRKTCSQAADEKRAETVLKAPDWVCALATDSEPKSCLIWGDAAEDTKVVRPRGACEQWVSLQSLNSLRRRDSVKTSRLWFDQYALDMRAFSRAAGPSRSPRRDTFSAFHPRCSKRWGGL